jgi:hypothetical protein
VTCLGGMCDYTYPEYCNRYTSEARDIDSFVWEHPELLALVPAGDANALNGESLPMSLMTPGTCKNCLSVGSSHTFHKAALLALSHVDAMDYSSATAAGHRLMCPRCARGAARGAAGA